MFMHRRNAVRAVALAAALTLAPASSAFAAVGATLAPGSKAMTLGSATTLANGLVQSTWQGAGGMTDTMVAPAGSTLSIQTVTINGQQATQATVTPPQLAGVAPPTGTAAAADTAAASWTNPPNHTWFNPQSNEICKSGECVYGSSQQYAYNETKGNWIMGQKTTGTISPQTPGASCLGSVYTRFPGEVGDSGPLAGYSPSADTTSSSGTYNVSFSYGGISIGSSVTRTSAVFGPFTPNRYSNGAPNYTLPAFGSGWDGFDYGGCTQRQEGLGSADAIHLGAGQNPYDQMIELDYTDL
jgi:hypothetical protein